MVYKSHRTSDSDNLRRFIEAQAPIYQQVRSELAEGRRRGHWMWFIFPQIAGLSLSENAMQYALRDIHEAAAYLEHPLLGFRLRECTSLVNAVQDRTVNEIFGYPDNLKFHASITLFDRAAAMRADNVPSDQVFNAALRRHFQRVPDYATLRHLDPLRR